MTAITPINRGGASDIEAFAMANCLMILSSQSAANNSSATAAAATGGDFGRMFACKTCGKKFSSFQALGGHRASHKKIKPSVAGGDSIDGKPSSPPKPKAHACSICGLEFPIGQALGGHMRRHRPLLTSGAGAGAGSTITNEDSTEKSDGNNNGERKRKSENDVVLAPVLMKSGSCKRVCLDLDLNLSAWKEEKIDEDNDDHHVDDDDEEEVEEGEIVEQEEDEDRDFLKLELRQPINW